MSPLTFTPTSYRPAALADLVDGVAPHWKGAPPRERIMLRTLAGSGLDALAGVLPLPLMLLRESAIAHTIARMARFAEQHRALLAPHAKTTMSPELIARQIDAGCWAVSAATPSHVDTLRRLGVQRILIANELVEPSVIRWLADELTRDPAFELLCLVDSIRGVELLDRELRTARSPRPIAVLLEIGVAGGRSGVRTGADADAVAAAVAATPTLQLAGIECFEGLTMDPDRISETVAAVDAHLAACVSIGRALDARGLLSGRILSAGGSAFFDRVLACRPGPEWQVVLRSGCYVSQDGGFYASASPLAGRGTDAEPLLDAIELWGAVLSSPEEDVVVVGVGKRDAPFDITPPVPVAWRSPGGDSGGALSGDVQRLNDQHATIRIRAGDSPAVGDLVRFAISHPCGAFDRWRVIPLVDADHRITGAVHTTF